MLNIITELSIIQPYNWVQSILRSGESMHFWLVKLA